MAAHYPTKQTRNWLRRLTVACLLAVICFMPVERSAEAQTDPMNVIVSINKTGSIADELIVNSTEILYYYTGYDSVWSDFVIHIKKPTLEGNSVEATIYIENESGGFDFKERKNFENSDLYDRLEHTPMVFTQTLNSINTVVKIKFTLADGTTGERIKYGDVIISATPNENPTPQATLSAPTSITQGNPLDVTIIVISGTLTNAN
jgi:hypothetical protein